MSTTKLISATPKAEDLIAYCARVSNPTNQDNPEYEKLMKYLIKHNHWSPFELAHVVMEIETTRAIAAQILRHRSFSFQEFSQRYADVSLMSFARPPHLRRQDTKNRQNSIDDLSPDKTEKFYRQICLLYAQSEDLYRELVSNGVAKESAREILPLGTPTRLYMSGSVRSWLHYIDLRRSNGTQLEHQQIARDAETVLRGVVPAVCCAMWD
jgi:thymidylate synthase (FAD)